MTCTFVTTCLEKFTICDLPKKKHYNFLKMCYMMMCMSIHVVLPWDLIISMSIFYNYKLLSCATCYYSKQLKSVSLNMS